MSLDPALFEENERTAPHEKARKFAQVGPLTLDQGGVLEEATVAYETWGALNASASNAVLICHALSGDSHAVGWWERMIGPGKPIDTNEYFVIGTNALGGCQGSTGPSSIAPDGRAYGMRFPFVGVGDMVEAQIRLIEQLGIDVLHAVVGGSMGGMQAIEWSLRRPGRVRKVVGCATCAAHSAMQIGFNEASRQAIMRDPKWRGGDYGDDPPTDGLAVARMIGHLTYLSDHSFESKFSRRVRGGGAPTYDLKPEFEVQTYLAHQGEKFSKRFDPNSFLVLSRAIDYYERSSFAGSNSAYLFTSFTSDWLYPSYQSERCHALAMGAGRPSQWVDIDLPYGHDAFLLDGEKQGLAVRRFLAPNEQ